MLLPVRFRFMGLVCDILGTMIRIIFFTLVVVLLLSFFGISIEGVVHSSTSQANFSYVGDLLQQGWNDLIAFINGLTYNIIHLF